MTYKDKEKRNRTKNIYRKNHPESTRKIHRNYILKSKYNLTPEQYNEMLKKQDFKCAICGHPFDLLKLHNAEIDHNHQTNKVRGILCHKCNVVLGMANDNINVLYSAIKYLKESDKNE